MYGVIDVRNKSNERDVLSVLYSKSKYFTITEQNQHVLSKDYNF